MIVQKALKGVLFVLFYPNLAQKKQTRLEIASPVYYDRFVRLVEKLFFRCEINHFSVSMYIFK
jgi:hypothetical protein